MEFEVELGRWEDNLAPALEEYSQHDRPQEENEEHEEDFLIFDLNLDRGVQQVSPGEGRDLWNIRIYLLTLLSVLKEDSWGGGQDDLEIPWSC